MQALLELLIKNGKISIKDYQNSNKCNRIQTARGIIIIFGFANK